MQVPGRRNFLAAIMQYQWAPLAELSSGLLGLFVKKNPAAGL
jgi:hypothetical protein